MPRCLAVFRFAELLQRQREEAQKRIELIREGPRQSSGLAARPFRSRAVQTTGYPTQKAVTTTGSIVRAIRDVGGPAQTTASGTSSNSRQRSQQIGEISSIAVTANANVRSQLRAVSSRRSPVPRLRRVWLLGSSAIPSAGL